MGSSSEKLKQIHHRDKSYETTCLVTAKMLTYIYNKIGIEARIVPTSEVYKHRDVEGEVVDIYHYFVVAVGELNKKYFLTLNNDLHNIQCGFRTQFFGNQLDYLDKNGMPVYEGEEIDYTVMPKDKLKTIDQKIGYLTRVSDVNQEKYDYVSMNSFTNENQYIQDLIYLDESKFYEGIAKLFEGFDKEGYNSLTEQETNIVKRYICHQVQNLISKILQKKGFDVEDGQIEELNSLIEQNNFSSWLSDLRRFIQQFHINAKEETEMFDNPFAIVNYTNHFIMAIDNFKMNLSVEERQKNASNYRQSLNQLSKFFIPKERLRKNIKNNQGQQYFSNQYLLDKFLVMFSGIFGSSNEMVNENRQYFNELGFLEQSKILKKYIHEIFSVEFANEDALYKRVMFSIARSKDDLDDYKFFFGFYNEEYDDEPYFVVFSSRNNFLEVNIDLLPFRMQYDILSKTIQNKFERR